jgi:hypothetical protein
MRARKNAPVGAATSQMALRCIANPCLLAFGASIARSVTKAGSKSLGVKIGRTQNERIFPGLPSKADHLPPDLRTHRPRLT